MEFEGKIIAILNKREGVAKSTGNAWCVQEFVIENHDQYPKKMCFEVFGEDKLSQFSIQMGEELKISFDIDCRQWNDRWFNSLRAWRVERVAENTNAGMPEPQAIPGATSAPTGMPTADSDDTSDLPF
ncbi:MAG: DUF3127 domain-containing protein [Bacteroidaceae bacterium]